MHDAPLGTAIGPRRPNGSLDRRGQGLRILDNIPELIERYQAGDSLFVLARAWGVSETVIRRVLVEHEVPIRGVVPSPRRGPARDVAAMAARRRAGATLAEIGRDEGITGERVRQLLVKYG